MDQLKRFLKLPKEYEKNILIFEQEFEKYLFEQYQHRKNHNLVFLKFFYSIKPLIPRFLQIYFRQKRVKRIKDSFPKWPIDTTLEDLKKRILKNLNLEGTPFIWFWPEGKRFAFILTHDVETKQGLKNINKICKIEKKFSFRSGWFFVPERYPISDKLIQELKEQGFEIGIHGLKHDGKLFRSKKIFDERMKRIKEYALKWDAKGFRSPSLLRNAEWIKEIPFEYDSSFPDIDPYGPQPGGCLSIFPFFIGNIVELPVTLPQDHTIFVILKEKNISIWQKKIDWIEEMNGLALLIVHPDYFDKNIEKYYIELLDYVSKKENYWHTLPSKVSDWWRCRDCVTLVKDANSSWTISSNINNMTIQYL